MIRQNRKRDVKGWILREDWRKYSKIVNGCKSETIYEKFAGKMKSSLVRNVAYFLF